MAKLVSLLISSRQQRVLGVLSGILIFAVLIFLSLFFALREVQEVVVSESRNALAHRVRLTAELDTTFAALKAQVTAEPCSPEFRNQLRRVAYLPDGFSDFLYAPDGVVVCSLSVARFSEPVRLGPPDILPSKAAASALWVDRGLGFLGLGGLVGSIALRDNLAIVVPPRNVAIAAQSWLQMELVLVGEDGRWWHRAGEGQIYDRYTASQGPGVPLLDPTLRNLLCEGTGRFCIATQVEPMAFLAQGKIYVLAILAIILVVSAWAARGTQALIVRHWAFEARFRRHLDAQSIVCAYQPILSLKTGRIIGCEVLARWRDVDDSIAYPDRFIPLVEKFGLTAKFTALVVRHAFEELSAALPAGERLTLTFNVFPRDLDAALLRRIFEVFDAAPGRFDLVIEIVESEAIVIADAQREIEALRKAGIRTYIDDFGTGYSNIHNLAALSVDGVKLDRAFAMAPDGSLMAKMLGHAIEMIHASGRAMVVEGVETAERLRLLGHITPTIDYAQGYHISRPLDAAHFAEFLACRAGEREPVDLAA